LRSGWFNVAGATGVQRDRCVQRPGRATWKINGQATKAACKATITYNGTLKPGYKVTLVGKVAKDGSVSSKAGGSPEPPSTANDRHQQQHVNLKLARLLNQPPTHVTRS